MRQTLLWDLPTRLFHWVFSIGFIAAFAIAKLVGKRSDAFAYHMFIGLMILVAVFLRLIWGLAGTRYARFASFAYSPMSVYRYLAGVFSNQGKHPSGRNPASAYAAIAMVVLMIVLIFTGIMSSRGMHEAGEVHELISYLLLAVAISHVLGIIIHMIRLGDPIELSMIDGKSASDQSGSISTTRPVAAIIGLLLLIASIAAILSRYDSSTRKLTLPGIGVVAAVKEKKGDQRFRTRHEED